MKFKNKPIEMLKHNKKYKQGKDGERTHGAW
jgi:hypothetical protein